MKKSPLGKLGAKKKATRKRAAPVFSVLDLTAPDTRKGRRAAPKAKKAEPVDPKERMTVHVRRSLIERSRAAVVSLAAPPERLTLAGLAEAALEKELERLEKKYNGGRPVPAAKRPLRGGRPIGS